MKVAGQWMAQAMVLGTTQTQRSPTKPQPPSVLQFRSLLQTKPLCAGCIQQARREFRHRHVKGVMEIELGPPAKRGGGGVRKGAPWAGLLNFPMKCHMGLSRMCRIAGRKCVGESKITRRQHCCPQAELCTPYLGMTGPSSGFSTWISPIPIFRFSP